jgi:hypothetical protein
MGARHDLVGHKLAALSINLNIVKVHLLLDGLAQSDSSMEISLLVLGDIAEKIRDVMAGLRPVVWTTSDWRDSGTLHDACLGLRLFSAVSVSIRSSSCERPFYRQWQKIHVWFIDRTFCYPLIA